MKRLLLILALCLPANAGIDSQITIIKSAGGFSISYQGTMFCIDDIYGEQHCWTASKTECDRLALSP